MIVEYDSNNSGGGWWLKDEDWHNLEKAGWIIEWYKDKKDTGWTYTDDRWLGALATGAKKDSPSPRDAILEFEKITGQDASAEGCNCCGPPHSFSWDDEEDHDYVSGEGVLRILHNLEEVPTLREMVEKLKKENQQ